MPKLSACTKIFCIRAIYFVNVQFILYNNFGHFQLILNKYYIVYALKVFCRWSNTFLLIKISLLATYKIY